MTQNNVPRKRCLKKDLNDVLDFCRENNINIGYSLDSNSVSTFELTDGDQITYYDDKEIVSIALDFYDITTNLIEELSTMINIMHLRKVVWVYKT
jgi:hypothetical protein